MAYRNRLKVKQPTPAAPRPPVSPRPPRSFFTSPIWRAEREDQLRSAGISSAELRAYTTPEGQKPDALATRNIQALLNQNGFKLKIDGVYGPQTDTAYQEFLAKRPELRQQRLEQMYDGFAAKREAENQKVLNEAAAARIELQRIADNFSKTVKDKQGRQTLRQLRELATDPVRFDNKAVVETYREIQRAQREARETARKKPKSTFQKVLGAFTANPLARGFLTAISYPQEQIAQAYYSGKRAQLQGASSAQEARAAIAGLPGLGFVAGKGKLRRAVEDVNSPEERAALTEAGELASFGEFVSGRARDKLRPEFAKNLPRFQLPTPVRGVASAGLDLGFQVGTDPLNALFAGAGSLARVGEVAGEAGLRAAAQQAGRSGLGSTRRIARSLGDNAVTAQQAGRISYIMDSRTGRALLDQATTAVARNQDVRSLRKAVRNLPSEVAVDVLKTARTAGINAARGKLARAFVEGTWNPVVKLNRQARVGLGSSKVGRAVRPDLRGDRLRRFVRGTEPSAGLTLQNPQMRLASAVESSLRQVEEFRPDFYKRVVKPETAGLGIRKRLNRVERLANELTLPRFSDDIEKELDRLADLYQQTRQRLPVGARQPLVDEIERGLQRLETAAAVMRGDAGETALRQAVTAVEQIPTPRAGLGVNPLRRAGQLALSITEPMAPPSVRLEGAANPAVSLVNRVESLDRWASALGADDATLYAIRRAAEEATTEQQLYRIVHDVLVRTAEAAGVEADNLIDLLNARVREGRARRGFGVDESGELIEDVQNLSQLVEDIPLLPPTEVASTIRQLRAAAGSRGAAVRVGLGNRLPRTRKLLEDGHKLWKFNIVTNAYAPIVGAGVGFASGDTMEDRLKGAAAGAAIGALGPARYILRVAGTEEKLRYFFERGFAPKEWVPYLSKWSRRRGVELPFVSQDIVRAGNEFGNHLRNRALVSVDNSWVALTRKEPRFVDGWWRIVNHQLHPETDTLAAIFLERKAGLIKTDFRAVREAKKFLDTPDGQLVYRRLKGGMGGPKTYDEVIERYKSFVDDYVPEEVAVARLNGEVDRALLKSSLKTGTAPTTIHAQKTWVIPRNARDFFSKVNQLTGKLVLEGPTTKMNRIPLAEWIYHDEFQRLRGLGLEAKRAQRIADEFATERTNSIMFQINDESRFAKKVDFVFPFQQPREELLRVWGGLLAKNPGRTFRTVRLAALGFNHGAEQGMFRKDDFTGEWTMTVPGSAYIANRLFGVNVGFDANLRDFLFFGQGAYGINAIPTFGGPYWQVLSRSFINANPEVYENMDSRLKNLLFPYGSTGKLARNEPNRLWMAFAGSPAPWEFFSKFEQENELRRWTVEMFLQLKHEHFLATGDSTWEPTEEEVIKATKEFFKVWAFTGSIFPASPRPVFPGQEAFDAAKLVYTNSITGKFDYERFVEENPQFAPFLQKRTKYVGPDDYKHWTRTQEEKANDWVLHYSKRATLSEFREDLKEAREQTAAYKEREQAFNVPVPMEREAALQAWRAKYPELADRTRQTLLRDVELNHILSTYPASEQPAALDRWRKEYNVTHQQYLRLKEKVKTANYSPWRFARDTEDVVKDVAAARRAGVDELSYVAGLAPAEQVRWWQAQVAEMDYQSRDNPQFVLDRYNNAKAQISAIYKANPGLRSTRPKSDWEKAIANWRGDYTTQVNAAYKEIDLLRPAMDAAAKGKDWKTYYALKDKRTALYDHIKALKNQQYRSMPELAEFESDVSAVLYFQKPGQKPFVGDGDVEFLPSNEEQRFLSMPEPVRQAYLDDLMEALEKPAGKEGKLFFEWLTTFQQELLESNLPPEMVNAWRASRPDPDGAGTANAQNGELAFASAMFKQYNQRGKGAQPPAGYQEYLNLPKNPAVRSQFLRSHPAVAAWIKQGPMANMPEVLRQIVANIMIKNGRWEGELKTMDEITEVSFAREQLSRWNRRAGDRPSAYDTWVNLPTGPDKANFLKEHPEVQDWIRLGPMSNMPDEYREVVRDIMQRYGEWTQRNDPLGDVISGFYKVPSYARDKYLEEHPELLAYWAATRSPEENAMYALADQYYAIPEQGARRLFLQAHPELQEFFIEARTRRYERFLNRVAQFMGANPELFTEYLQRQEDILAELLNRFGEPQLVREVPRLTSQEPSGRRSQIRAAA